MRNLSRIRLPAGWRCLLAFVLGILLGRRARRWLHINLLGYELDKTANVGNSFIRVARLRMAPGSQIGHFSVIRNVDLVELGENANIGTFNWVFGMPTSIVSPHFEIETDRTSTLHLGRESCLTSRHIVDCTDRVTIGAFTTIAGFSSQILTHGIDTTRNRQSSAPVTIGRHCLIGSGCLLLKGAVVPDHSVVAAGSVFRGTPEQTHQLFSGVPAAPVKTLPGDLPYFARDEGPVA
jgi:acetyltransferase-like isoleucine patch superfamily enzyme